MTKAGEDQRREHLVRRHARRLHRDHLAVLVEPVKAINVPSRTENGRKRDDQEREAQRRHRSRPPRRRCPATARILPRFAEQVEGHQDQHQRDQDREGAGEEQLPM